MPYRCHRIAAALWVAATFAASHAIVASAQDVAVAERGPRFLMASARRATPTPLDLRTTPALRQAIALQLNRATLPEALAAITKATGLAFVYGVDLLPASARVSVRAEQITVAAALTQVLLDTDLDVLLLESRKQIALVRRGSAGLPIPTGAIVGRVTDAKTGVGVAGAEIFLEGTKRHATSDTAGRYGLADVDTGSYDLTVRRLGYAKQSQRVMVPEGRTDTVNVVLEPVPARLQELITTATGQRRRLDIANDVTTINADSVMQVQPVRNVTDLLETRVPGLTVQHTSGAPGDPSRLRLRGVSSPLGNNDPIVIVDGIRYYGQQSANRGANLAARPIPGGQSLATDSVASTGVNAAPSPLEYIDPNIIETIEVLKGPSAATMYGQDAANGVIVITTKKGKAGPARWTANVEHGRTQIEGDYPNLLWRWGRPLYEDRAVRCPISGIVGTEDRVAPGAPCSGDSVVTFQLLNDPGLTVLDRGYRTALSFGVSGGSSALTYAVRGTYGDEVGILKLPAYEIDRYQEQFDLTPPDWMQRPQDFKRWGVTSTVGMHVGTTADVSLTATLTRNAQQKSTLQDQLGTLMSAFLDRASGDYYTYYLNSSGTASGIDEARELLASYRRRVTANATQFTNGATFNWRPRSWLTVTADAGVNYIHRVDQEFFPRGPTRDGGAPYSNSSTADTVGYVNNGQGSSIQSTVNVRGNALAPIGRGFQFRFAAGVNYTGTSTNDMADGTDNLAPGSSAPGSLVTFVRGAEASDATFGWYMEPSIGNSKLNINAGLRLDGSSNYGANVSGFKLPTFPKLGLSYLISDEPWFPFKNLVQSLRVRLAYGKASRQPGATDRLRLYSLRDQVYLDNDFQSEVTLQSLGNTEVRPERSTEFEGGFDADLFDNRITLIVSGYRKNTDDALLYVPVAPSVFGDGANIIKNIGVIRNTGLELSVGSQLLRSRPVTWDVQVQVSRRRDMVIRLAPGVAPYYIDQPIASGYLLAGGTRVAPGYPLFGRWSRPILGYADANGDGVLQANEVQLGDTAVYVGSTLPNYEASLATTVSLWNRTVTINAAFNFQDGLSQRNELARQLAVFSAGQEIPLTPLADQAATIDLSTTPEGPIRKTDYNWIQTVSITRFNSLSVSYRVPSGVARRVGAQDLSLAVQGSNLSLWTNYRGLDPNVNAFGTGNQVTDTGVLPLPRTWQVRVSASY